MTEILMRTLPYVTTGICAGWGGVVYRRLKSERTAYDALYERMEEQLALKDELLETATKLQNEETRLREEMEKKMLLAVRAKDEQFAVISDAVNERNQWQKLYRKSSIANQTAQDWLMREVERLLVVANAYAKQLKRPRVRVDAQLRDLVAQFAEEHGDGTEVETTGEASPQATDTLPGGKGT